MMSGTRPPRHILLVTTGLRVGGGIASVSRCILRALAEEVDASRLERVDLLSFSDAGAPMGFCNGISRSANGSRLRFVALAWRMLVQT